VHHFVLAYDISRFNSVIIFFLKTWAVYLFKKHTVIKKIKKGRESFLNKKLSLKPSKETKISTLEVSWKKGVGFEFCKPIMRKRWRTIKKRKRKKKRNNDIKITPRMMWDWSEEIQILNFSNINIYKNNFLSRYTTTKMIDFFASYHLDTLPLGSLIL